MDTSVLIVRQDFMWNVLLKSNFIIFRIYNLSIWNDNYTIKIKNEYLFYTPLFPLQQNSTGEGIVRKDDYLEKT